MKMRIFKSVADLAAGWRGGGKKHEIYGVAFGSNLFYNLFLQDRGAWPPLAPLDPLL